MKCTFLVVLCIHKFLFSGIICRETANGIINQDRTISPDERKELGEALCNLFINVIHEPTFGIIWNNGKKLADVILKKRACRYFGSFT